MWWGKCNYSGRCTHTSTCVLSENDVCKLLIVFTLPNLVSVGPSVLHQKPLFSQSIPVALAYCLYYYTTPPVTVPLLIAPYASTEVLLLLPVLFTVPLLLKSKSSTVGFCNLNQQPFTASQSLLVTTDYEVRVYSMLGVALIIETGHLPPIKGP